MGGNFDYNNDEVMNILNNPNFTEEQKKALFERYKSDLKEKRKKEIIRIVNECAKTNPIITEEEYIEVLKKYSNDDLSKPFEIIEKELAMFSKKMQDKYDAYSKAKAAEAAKEQAKIQEAVAETPAQVETPVEATPSMAVAPEKETNLFDDLGIDEDITPDVTPINYKPSNSTKTNTLKLEKNVKEVMPSELNDDLNEKGSASAVIISIIAIIIGMVIMYSIIKLK